MKRTQKMGSETNNMVNSQSLFQRLALITGEKALEKFALTKVIIFGVGGVGSWCAEALVRSGIGKIGIVDYDIVCESNVNRQVQATCCTLGRIKVDILQQRLLDINPKCEVTASEKMFSRENVADFGIETADYIIDAIDTMPNKLDLIEASYTALTSKNATASKNTDTKLFSSMGMAWRMDPTRIKIGSIWKTQGCPLARNVRHGLRKRGFEGDFTVVYSDEKIKRPEDSINDEKIKGSAVTVTASAGMILASLVLRDIIRQMDEKQVLNG
jgi:tRNA A37 threonylcarbamoyladenosine dehydratase